MFPRASATLLDSARRRFLTRYQVALETLQPDNEAALNHLLEAQLPAHVEAAFEEASRAIEGGMARLIEAVPAIDPTLEGAARSSLGRMQHDLRTLHEKIIHAAKRRDETLRRQYARTRAQAFPDGPSAGAERRARVLPEPLRPVARRSPARRPAARHREALGDDDLAEQAVGSRQ